MFEKQTNGIKDLQLSIIEGSFAVILLTVGASFIVPFAVYLGASSVEIGFLAAFPVLFASWIQIISIKMLERFKSRKRVIVFATFLQALLFLPLAVIYFAFPSNGVFWLIFFYTASLVIGSLPSPLWQSWMKDLTPPVILGRYFGFRNLVVGSVAFIFLLIFGFALQLFDGALPIVFLGIFLLSAVGRFVSSSIFTKISEKPFVFPEKNEFNFLEFTKELTKTNFGHFVLFGSLMAFGIALFSPFVSFYLLDGLGLKNDYFMYTLIISAGMVATLIGMPYWGKMIDRFGVVKVLKASSLMACVFPLLYVVVRAPEGLIAVQFFSGLIYSGLNLALANFVYDVSNQQRIVRYAAYQNVFFGTATFVGAILAGYLIAFQVSFFLLSNMFFVMCFVALLVQYLSYKMLIGKIVEVKQVELIHSKQIVFSVITFAPVIQALSETAVPFENGLKSAKRHISRRLKRVELFVEKGAEVVEGRVVTRFTKKSVTKKKK